MPETHPTIDEIRRLLDYDAITGALKWRARAVGMTFGGLPIPSPNRLRNWNALHAGASAGNVGNHGYIQVGICGKRYLAHRIIWAIHSGEWPSDQIDHVNGDRSDNRICNLRPVSNLENGQNQKLAKNNTSGAVGVGWHARRKTWAAYICVSGKQKTLGYFKQISAAIAARKTAERAAGFHPNHRRK